MKVIKKQDYHGSPLFLNAEIKHPGLEYFSDEDDYCRGFANITKLSRDELNTTSLKEVNYSEIQPIKLTEDLLKDLGFKEDSYTNLSPDYYFEDDNIRITINLKSRPNVEIGIWVWEKNGLRRNSSFSFDRTGDPKIKELYLHQLQYLVSMVGYELESEL